MLFQRLEMFCFKMVRFLGPIKGTTMKNLKDGVFEIKIPHASGRVYFGEGGDQLILLLIGGNKRTQSRDIKKAMEYWSYYGKQK